MDFLSLLYSKIFQKWATPDVDIMASSFNNKLDSVATRSRDPLAFAVISWTPLSLVYAFSPLKLLPQLLLMMGWNGFWQSLLPQVGLAKFDAWTYSDSWLTNLGLLQTDLTSCHEALYSTCFSFANINIITVNLGPKG